MSYAVEADVRRYLGIYSEFWTATSVPTIVEGLKFTDQASGEIDGILSARGILTPVAAPALFVAHLRDMAAAFAAAQISKAFFQQSAGPASSTTPDYDMGLWKDWIAALTAGTGIPADIAMSGSALPTSFGQKYKGYASADLDEGEGDTDPVFRRDMKW